MLYDMFECCIIDVLLIFGMCDDKGMGCVYFVVVVNLLGGCGDGVLLMMLIEFVFGMYIVYMFVGYVEQNLVIFMCGGNGFLVKVGDMVGCQKVGKVFLMLDEGD